MLIPYIIHKHNVKLIDFDVVIANTLDMFSSSLEQYHIKNDVSNKTVQKFFIHSLITILCETLKQVKPHERAIFLVNTNTELFHPCEKEVLFALIHRVLANMPFKKIMYEHNIHTFYEKLCENDTDTTILFENAVTSILNFDLLHFNYRKMLTFLKKNDLIYLYDTYFSQAANKLLVVR